MTEPWLVPGGPSSSSANLPVLKPEQGTETPSMSNVLPGLPQLQQLQVVVPSKHIGPTQTNQTSWSLWRTDNWDRDLQQVWTMHYIIFSKKNKYSRMSVRSLYEVACRRCRVVNLGKWSVRGWCVVCTWSHVSRGDSVQTKIGFWKSLPSLYSVYTRSMWGRFDFTQTRK